ncbi:hypothetical protein JW905_04630 [bacterium]|nr:hypothetical protein [candidate division CSSED10-310 bacterium]
MKAAVSAGLVMAICGLAVTETCRAEADWMWHGSVRDPERPGMDDDVEIWVKIGYQFYVTDVTAYYTTDGGTPRGSRGMATTGTVAQFVWRYVEYDPDTGMYIDWWSGTLPAAAVGTTVNYRISSWHSGGGVERFADNNTTDPDAADIFSYKVKGEVTQSFTGVPATIVYKVCIPGVTDDPGAAPGLQVELLTNVDQPPGAWTEVGMTYDGDEDGCDRYIASLGSTQPGTYLFIKRHSTDGGGTWTYQGNPGDESSMPCFNVSPAWIASAVLYQIFPRIYGARDINSNGEIDNDEFGDLGDIEADLDRIEALGVNTLWLMPLHPLSTNPDYIKSLDNGPGSPYAPKDYYAINPDYGGIAALDSLVAAVHDRGMRVIIGYVPNHMAPDNVLLPDHLDWFRQNQAGEPIPDLPDWWDTVAFNYDCEEQAALWEYQVEAMAYWLEQHDIDGYRGDIVQFQPIPFWEYAMGELIERVPDKLFLGEAYGLYKDLEASGFHSVYDADTYWDIVNNIRTGQRYGGSIWTYLDEFDADHAGGYLPLRFVENHDERRAADTYGSPEASKPHMYFNFFTRALPMLYNGQESGETVRIPLFKGWYEDCYLELDFNRNPAYTAWLSSIIHLRTAHPFFALADMYPVGATNPHFFCAARKYGGERALVVINFCYSNAFPQSGTLNVDIEELDLQADDVLMLESLLDGAVTWTSSSRLNQLIVTIPQYEADILMIEIAGKLGDVDRDGDRDETDVELILLRAVGRLTPATPFDLIADVDGDGMVTAGDAVALLHRTGNRTVESMPLPRLVITSARAHPGEYGVMTIQMLEGGEVAGADLAIQTHPSLLDTDIIPGPGLQDGYSVTDRSPCPDGWICNEPDPEEIHWAFASIGTLLEDEMAALAFVMDSGVGPGVYEARWNASTLWDAGGGNVPHHEQDGGVAINAPRILLAGYAGTQLTTTGGELQVMVLAEPSVTGIEFYVDDLPTGIFIPVEDQALGFFSMTIALDGPLTPVKLLMQMVAHDTYGLSSIPWPAVEVE